MTLIQSKAAKGIIPLAYPTIAGAVVAQRFTHTFSSAPSANDILELAPLPANTKIIDLILDSDDLDSNGAPTITFDVGIMSGNWGDEDNARTCDDVFFDGATVGQAGGVVRPTAKTAFRQAAGPTDRSIGVKIATAAATFQAGEVGLTVLYAAAG